MSEQDRDAILGRTVREHAECSKTLAALHAEAEHIGNFLTAVGHALRTNHSLYAGSFGSFSGQVDLQKWPSAATLSALTSEIAATLAEQKRLTGLLKDASYESKPSRA